VQAEPSVVTAQWQGSGLALYDVAFAPLHRFGAYTPERPYVAVVIAGGLAKTFPARSQELSPPSAVVMPAEARHLTRFGAAGARVLKLEVDLDDLGPCAGLFDRIRHLRAEPIASAARRLACELRARDAFCSLALEGLSLELLAGAARLSIDPPTRPPPWLRGVEERLHDSFSERLRVTDLADAAGVHPVHLARVFRARHGISLAEYVRRLRLDWAASCLVSSEEAIASIAAGAGFADQSHFTRSFKRYTGLTPARYRAALRA
jgi:AraC family transcriptional regulator